MRIGPSISLTQFRGSGVTVTRIDAPGNIVVEVDHLDFSVTFDEVLGAISYRWRIAGDPGWTDIGIDTSFDSFAAAGAHTVQIQGIAAGGVHGKTGNSDAFTLAPVAAPVFSVDPVATSDGDLANPVVGDTLHSTTGAVSGSPAFAYQWRHVSDDSDATGTDSDTADYPIDASDEGEACYCHITATNAGGSATANSNASGVVAEAPPAEGTPLNALQTFEAGSDGNALTAALLNAGETGDAWTWTADRDPGGHTYIETTSETHYAVGDVTVEGAAVSGTGSRCIKFDHAEAVSDALSPVWDAFNAAPPESISKCVFTGFVYFGASGASTHTHDHWKVNAGPYLVMQQQLHATDGGTAGRVHLETQQNGGSTVRSSPIAIDVGLKHVELWFNNDTGSMGLILRDPSDFSFFGCTFYISNDSAGDPITNVVLQDYLTPESGYTLHDEFGRTWKTGDIAFPLFPLTDLPSPSSVTLAQTAAGTVDLDWDNENAKGTFKIEIHNGTSWSTLETAVVSSAPNTSTAEPTYTKASLTNGLTYKMRVTTQMGSASSAAVESNTVTIDDSPYSGGWHDSISSASTNAEEELDGFAIFAPITLPAGTVGRLRVFSSSIPFPFGVKLALYNSSKALLGGDTTTTVVSPDEDPEWIECDLGTPIVISSGSYYIGFIGNSGAGKARYISATGSAKLVFTNYAAFGPPNPFDEDQNLSRSYAVGAYVF